MSGRHHHHHHHQQQQGMGVYKAKERLHDVFLHSGCKDLFMLHIHQKCIQYGWSTTMREAFLDYVKSRGTENVNVSHMIIDLARLGRDLFPTDLRKILLESMFEVAKQYFTIDDSVPAITEPDNPNSEAEKTFLFQPRDVRPDPGVGVGVLSPDSPPPQPEKKAETQKAKEGAGATAAATTTSRASATVTKPSSSSTGRSQEREEKNVLAVYPCSKKSDPPWSLLPPKLTPEVGPSNVIEEYVTEEEDVEEEEEEEPEVYNVDDEDEDELMDV